MLIPLMPGEHTLKIDWREPRGMGWMFRSTPHGLGAADGPAPQGAPG